MLGHGRQRARIGEGEDVVAVVAQRGPEPHEGEAVAAQPMHQQGDPPPACARLRCFAFQLRAHFPEASPAAPHIGAVEQPAMAAQRMALHAPAAAYRLVGPECLAAQRRQRDVRLARRADARRRHRREGEKEGDGERKRPHRQLSELSRFATRFAAVEITTKET
ncbi:MAG: hypothetical protein RH982_15450 [Parvibaculum sp.]